MNKTQRAPGSAPTPAGTQSANAAAGNAAGLDDRADFEAWLRSRWPNAHRAIDEKTATGSYAFTENNLLWEAWQACAKLHRTSAEKAVVLPTWDQADAAVDADCATPLDMFVHDQEPAGPDDVRFRQQLLAALEFVARPAAADAGGQNG